MASNRIVDASARLGRVRKPGVNSGHGWCITYSNIGAYGVEVSDRLHSLRALNINTGHIHTFNAEECGFAYRDSIFKSQVAGQYVVIDVLFKLTTRPDLRLDYGDIRGELMRQQVSRITPMAVAQAVMAIRRAKLPDPAQLGNAGSFFKNPR